jgi:hypothetical protein
MVDSTLSPEGRDEAREAGAWEGMRPLPLAPGKGRGHYRLAPGEGM